MPTLNLNKEYQPILLDKELSGTFAILPGEMRDNPSINKDYVHQSVENFYLSFNVTHGIINLYVVENRFS